MGRADGELKTAAWAAPICGVDAEAIAGLARRLAGKRTLVVASHSLQRAEHGEQPIWIAAVLAAMLGQIGLPGGGYYYSLGAPAPTGQRDHAEPTPGLPHGPYRVTDVQPHPRTAH